jgi:hypothetical protein
MSDTENQPRPDGKVRCDDCGLLVRPLADDTVPEHRYTRHGVKYRCVASGKRYSRHTGTFTVIQRAPSGHAVLWLASCRCGHTWTGPDYGDVERPWAGHAGATPWADRSPATSGSAA